MEKNDLKLENFDNSRFSVCHWLKPAKDAGILVKFLDLDDKNLWLSKAKVLGRESTEVNKGKTISPDIPPVLRRLKSEIMGYRKNLPKETKTKSKVKYHKTWPYISLTLPDGSIYKPKIQIEDIVRSYYSPGVIALKDNPLQI